jgi:signal transduction histidine kinase
MPEGGQLRIKTVEQQKIGRDGVIVSVQDSGMGISVENQTRVFEPFFTTKADHGGTGLGLSVTYGIVSDHGGEIELISQPDQGSTFTVWLPKT